ncbi:hypothetical protein GCM10009792_01260 [Microcella alkalica]|uniref:Signal transduction histidine kinase n=1 Tax=Microcella alkalica TaxID=355930 RepID=A0A839E9D5_9MICO|nr:hypothetical protein [Microcella alkalica]MBA8847866.1 signal transduction histidine kinase [Microcella alkalica]
MASIALPRDVASGIIVRGFATAQRAIVVVGAVLTAVAVTVSAVSRGGDPLAFLAAILALVALAVVALRLLLRPTAARAIVFLAAGTAASVVYTTALLGADARLDEPGPFLVNRAATALVLVGALRGSAQSGVLWTSAGFLLAELSLVLGFALAGRAPEIGVTPLLGAVVVLIAYGALGVSRARARRRVPDLDRLQRELEIGDRERELERRAARVAHDTVLADLAIIAARPGPLDAGARARLERDLAVAVAGTVAVAVDVDGDFDAPTEPRRSPIADDLLELVHEYQWSGVTVDVSGCDDLVVAVDEQVRIAVLGATRAALDNVVRHAATDRAELVVGERDGTLSVLIVDDGVGFSSTRVDADRLGVRSSIDARVREVGGSVRVWSGDEGTTVMLSVPAGGNEVRT